MSFSKGKNNLHFTGKEDHNELFSLYHLFSFSKSVHLEEVLRVTFLDKGNPNWLKAFLE